MMASLLTHWFTPHYTNNHRPKLLQPIGLSVLVGLFIFFQSWLKLAELSSSLPGGYVLGFASNISASQVIDETNVERAKQGLPSLVVNEKLNQAAMAKAAHMFQNDYWAHVAPDGTNPWTFIKNAGYAYTVAGENLARDFDATGTMIQAWMQSPTHKANIIHTKYSQIGVAVVNGKLQGVETTLVVQMFGSPTTIAARTSDQGAQSNQPIVQKDPLPTAVPEVPSEPIPTAIPLDLAALTPIELPDSAVREPVFGTQYKATEEQKIISPLAITKIVASALIILLVLVLTYDTLMTEKRKIHRKVGNNWAHIGLFGIVLLIIIVMTQGRVL